VGNKIYYILQIIGWGAYFVLNSTFSIMSKGFDPIFLLINFNIVLSGFILTHLYREKYKDAHWNKEGIGSLSKHILTFTFGLALGWALWSIPTNYLILLASDLLDDKLTFGYFIIIWMTLSFITLLWLLLYNGVKVFKNFKQSEVEKWKLKAIIKDAELIALKSQINPHFIFNCLNNIRSLVIEDQDKARQMITHLSDLLRYSIQFSTNEEVTIEQELVVVKDYLQLESIQFEDRLRYSFQINEELMDFKIPPMSLQLLVENAIKHGISHLPAGGEINIRAFREDKVVYLQVDNSGKIKDKLAEVGIGLKNANDRMRLLFDHAKFALTSISADKVRAEFQISYESTGN